ncbi:hypothetical protein [Sorangium sp. So ce854]|uniref:hypothetical protein n=1 Tax=Sorangium sp. So ce854 TaxID=3133322 RepID=UPI003F603D11
MSWIDPRAELPEDDPAGDPGPGCTRSRILGGRAYRFANFLEAFVIVETRTRRILRYGFTQAAGIYLAPSAAELPPDPFETIRRATDDDRRVVFRQTVGARTVSPELIGEALGGFPGRSLAHLISGFPPIWTELELIIQADGTWSGRVLRHSLFPSMTYVEQERHLSPLIVPVPPDERARLTMRALYRPRSAFRGEIFVARPPYDGVPNYDNWNRHGWGAILARAGASGPTHGNPWGFQDSVADDMYRRFLETGRP